MWLLLTVGLLGGSVIGIDLGTTNSALALLSPDDARPELHTATPSTVAFLRDRERLVGQEAVDQAAQNPENTLHAAKRFLGRPYAQVVEDAARVGYAVVADEEGDVLFECPHLPDPVAPEEVSALVIDSMLESLRAADLPPVEAAVVTVPAYFREAQREATMAAAALAGLDEITLLAEPVAACLAYGLDGATGKVLVFDLGAGTFDVSVLSLGARGEVEVIATGGDPRLGGSDFDALLVDHVCALAVEAGIDPRADPRDMRQLRDAVEAAKIKLSVVKSVDIEVSGSSAASGGVSLVTLTLTRRELERVCEPLLQRLRAPLYEVALSARIAMPGEAAAAPPQKRAKKKVRDARRDALPDGPLKYLPQGDPLTEIVMVGGAGRMISVRNLVGNLFGVTPRRTVDPMEAVALGAAVYAGILQGRVEGRVLQKWQADLGRMLDSDSFSGV